MEGVLENDFNIFYQHQRFMREALLLARQAYNDDEVPVGAVIVHQGQIIGRGYNQVERFKDPTAHAEIIAITAACDYLKRKYLNDCTLYVTLEPCPMCAGALVWSKIDRIIYGAMDAKAGACGSIFNFADHEKLNHSISILSGIMEEECAHLLTKFFKTKRTSAD